MLPGAVTLKQLYWEQGLSQNDIRDRYNVYSSTVYRAFQKYNIPTRTRSQAQLLAAQQGKTTYPHIFNRGFFDKWSPQMAYVLGLVYADGHVDRHGKALWFGWSDSALIHNVIELMGSNKCPQQDKSMWCITFSSVPMCRRLNGLGVPFGKKSHIIKYPSVPPQYTGDFIRGYWEGDGSVEKYQVTFWSSSLSMLQDIQVHTEGGHILSKGKAGPVEFPNGKTYICNATYQLNYYRKEHRVLLYRTMYYNGLNESMVYASKRNKYKRLLEGIGVVLP